MRNWKFSKFIRTKANTLDFEKDIVLLVGVAFRITRERLEAKIQILGILYYEHYGMMEDSFLVNWYDESSKWLKKVNKSTVFAFPLLKETQLLYDSTLFVTTDVIQQQGLQHNTFACIDFLMLFVLVSVVYDCERTTKTDYSEVADH